MDRHNDNNLLTGGTMGQPHDVATINQRENMRVTMEVGKVAK